MVPLKLLGIKSLTIYFSGMEVMAKGYKIVGSISAKCHRPGTAVKYSAEIL
jgi:hypothetical protein